MGDQINSVLNLEENKEHHLQRWRKSLHFTQTYVVAWPRMGDNGCHQHQADRCIAVCSKRQWPAVLIQHLLFPMAPQDHTCFAVCRHKHILHCQSVCLGWQMKCSTWWVEHQVIENLGVPLKIWIWWDMTITHLSFIQAVSKWWRIETCLLSTLGLWASLPLWASLLY